MPLRFFSFRVPILRMMKRDKLIPVLYLLLADELSDLGSGMETSQSCANKGTAMPERAVSKRALNEMQNAGWLIERIIFFKGSLKVSKPDALVISKFVSDSLCNASESDTLNSYINTEKLTHEVEDVETTDLLGRIHKLQNDHAEWYGMALFT